MGKNLNRLYFLIFFLIFSGYYAILLLGSSIGFAESRSLTVPIRVFTALLILFTMLLNRKRLCSYPYLPVFILFSLFYLIRLLIEYYNNVRTHMPVPVTTMYYFAFAIIPFIGISIQRLNNKQFEVIKKAFVFGAFSFSVFCLYFYGKYIGQVRRLASNVADDNVLSPLILSYNGALAMGIALILLLTQKNTKLQRLFLIITLLMAIVPFFLGASRGSIIALFLPLVIYMYYSTTIKTFFYSIIIFVVVLFGIAYLDDYLGSGLLDRFLGTSEAISTGGSSASRLDIWRISFNQFLDNPLFGDSIVVKADNPYPHNIILEVLQSVGLIGFIPFIILLVKAFKICLNIFKNHIEYAWVAVVFIQAFSQQMFSLAIYTGAWFWASMALLFALNYSLKDKKLL